MALKTQPTKKSVRKYIQALPKERQADALTLLHLFEDVTKEKAVLWGEHIIGFGTYHYVYSTGNSGDWPLTGFAVRKTVLSVYIMAGFDKYDSLLEKIGKHKKGKSCLYLKNLDHVDLKALRKMIASSVKVMKKRYPQ